jgi:gamma-glutamyltranspeptidase/glutathione hydrolase
MPLFARNAVSTSHPLAAQAGLRMLLAGGNAVDAALAAAAMLPVVEPTGNGLGSDAFAIIWDGKKLHGLNSTGRSPKAWSLEYFKQRHGTNAKGHAVIPERGWDTVTVPGAVCAWGEVHKKFARLPFADLLAPAIEIAERGSVVPHVIADKWAAGARALEKYPGYAQVFMPNGRAPKVGERFTFSAAARTLRILAKEGVRAYYEGEIAEAIARWAQETGGSLTLEDLRNFTPQWVDPLSMEYRGYEMHQLPPNGQGISVLSALGILKHFDLPSLPVDSAASYHLQIEAMKLGFADALRYVADPRHMRVPPGQLLDAGYLAGQAKRIDPQKAASHKHGAPASGGTVYLTAADGNGMMVSFIQSNFRGFGSGVVVPGYGVSLQNRGSGFSGDPESVNVVAPEKHPYHTIIPGFLTRGGKPQMSFGIMGGDMQPQAHLQTCLRMVDHKQQPQAACDAPRWRVNPDQSLTVEGSMNPGIVATLESYGHKINVDHNSYGIFGSGQFIWRLSDDLADGYVVASDPRRPSLGVGF